MKQHTGFFTGLLIGTMASVAAAQGGVYFTVTELVNSAESSRTSYVAGVNDTLVSIDNYFHSEPVDPEADVATIRRWASCLRIRGARLGALRFYADDVWDNTSASDKKLSAAAVLIRDACK